jgi:tetratricopeptide (TPR) repeat protein
MTTRSLAVLALVALAASVAAADLPAQGTPGDVLLRAQILAARQSWPDAAAAYESAIAANPNDPVLRNQLGICYQRTGDLKAARAEYRAAVKLNPAYAEALNNLGTIEHARGKYKKAIAAYEKAIEIKPQDALFFKNLGAAWLAKGNVEKALDAWGTAVRLDPLALEGNSVKMTTADIDAGRQYYLFAKLVAARGQVDQAIEYLNKAHDAGFKDFWKIERDHDFADVVGDPRYAALK